MAGARSEVAGGGIGFTRRSGACEARTRMSLFRAICDCTSVDLRRPGMTRMRYFPFPPRLSRNTPCSPNMFQNHQGRFSRSGRP